MCDGISAGRLELCRLLIILLRGMSSTRDEMYFLVLVSLKEVVMVPVSVSGSSVSLLVRVMRRRGVSV